MKILNRYIFRELLGPFLVGLGFFTFIFVLNPILRLVDLLVIKKVPLFMILQLFFYLLPSTIAVVLPMAVLVAVLMAYGRLSSDSEIIAMRASGISYIKIFLPSVIFAVIISFVGIYFNDTLLPKGNFEFIKLYKKIVQMKPLTEVEEHTLTPIGNRIIGVDKISKKDESMYGVIIFERKRNGGVKTITAKKGNWIESREEKLPNGKILYIMRLQLLDGNIQQPAPNNLDEFTYIPFNKLIVNFTYEIEYSTSVSKGIREKSTGEIYTDIKNEIKQGKKPNRLWVEFYKRYTIPFAALAFVLIGLPFSIVSGRSGKSVSLGISILIIFVYYIFYAMGESMGKDGTLPPLLSMCIADFVFILAGLLLLYKTTRK